MNRIVPLAFVAAALLALVGVAPAVAQADASVVDPPTRVGRISFLQGEVTFFAEAGATAQPAVLNYPLTSGMELATGDGARAEVHVGSTALRLGPDSSLTFETLDDQTVQVRLDRGRLGVGVRSLGPGQAVQVDLQTASVSFGAPGLYRVDQQGSGQADLVSWEGDAEVTGGQASFHVGAGHSVSMPASGPDAALVASAPPPDDWDQWAAGRDRREDTVASARYVSREMDGVEDLDEFGSWSVVVGFGPVWTPSDVPAGWAPYTFGHWAWIAPWGWTWVDESPWGFAPFHYGRWALRLGAWCWVPGPIVVRPVFAPALVHWNGAIPTRDHPPGIGHVTWTPLRPGQVFHPPYPVSRPYFQALNGAARFRGPRPGVVTPVPVHPYAPRPYSPRPYSPRPYGPRPYGPRPMYRTPGSSSAPPQPSFNAPQRPVAPSYTPRPQSPPGQTPQYFPGRGPHGPRHGGRYPWEQDDGDY